MPLMWIGVYCLLALLSGCAADEVERAPVLSDTRHGRTLQRALRHEIPQIDISQADHSHIGGISIDQPASGASGNRPIVDLPTNGSRVGFSQPGGAIRFDLGEQDDGDDDGDDGDDDGPGENDDDTFSSGACLFRDPCQCWLCVHLVANHSCL